MDGPHTFAVRAVAGGSPDPTPATYGWRIARGGPGVRIVAGPTGGETSGPGVTFRYQATAPAAGFLCALGGTPAACSADGRSYADLASGPKTFTVQAVDAA